MTASLKIERSLAAARCSKVASATTMISALGFSSAKGAHRFVELREARRGATLGGEVGTVHHDAQSRTLGGTHPTARTRRSACSAAVHQSAARRRAGRLGARDVRHLEVAKVIVHLEMDEGPRAHVLWLFLEPDHVRELG